MSKHSGLPKLIGLLVVAPFAVFFPVLSFGFLDWDDPDHIFTNPLYQPRPFAHLAYFWTHAYFGDYIPLSRTVWAMLAGVSAAPNGQPVTTFDPSTYHAANLCLHIANVLLVFFILRFFVKKDWAAALGALLFAVHPLQVEPVAWVSGLRDLLCAFFSLACLLFYLMAIRQETADAKKGRWLAGASACYVLALLSKSSAVCVPLILLLIDYVLNRKVPKNRLLMLALWLVAAGAMILATEHAEAVGTGKPPLVAFWQRPFVAGDSFTFYLWKLFFPYPLGPDYGRTPTWVMSHAWAYLPILVPIALIVLVWRYWKSAPWLAIAIGIFLISLAPVSGIVPFAFQYYSTVADRYAYFAMLAPALAFAGILSLVPWRTAAAIGSCVLTVLAIVSATDVPAWATTTGLFAHGLRANPASPLYYWASGSKAQKAGNLDQAIFYFRTAARLEPDLGLAQYDLGQAQYNKWLADGRQPADADLLREARQHLADAVDRDKGSGLTDKLLAQAYNSLNRFPKAIWLLQTMIKAQPSDPENYYLIAQSYYRSGDKSRAKAALIKAAQMGYAPAVRDLVPQAPARP